MADRSVVFFILVGQSIAPNGTVKLVSTDSRLGHWRSFRPPGVVGPEALQQLGQSVFFPPTGRRRPAASGAVALFDSARREETPTTQTRNGLWARTCAFSRKLLGWVGLVGKGRLPHPACLRQPGPGRFAGRSTTNFLLPTDRGFVCHILCSYTVQHHAKPCGFPRAHALSTRAKTADLTPYGC